MEDNGSYLDLIRLHMREVKVPSTHDKVFKEECMFTFDTPESEGGLYINLATFQAFSAQYVDLDHTRTGRHLYLHEKWTRVPLPEEKQQAQEGKPEKLSVGGAGGFQVDAPKYDIEKSHKLVILPDRKEVKLPNDELPELVLQSIKAIMAHDSATMQEKVAVWEEQRKVSKYAANLEQLNNGKTTPADPKLWKCEDTGVTENLWLNLSTGHIGSGRQHWDGSGGNGSALRHFEATGKKYPLVVKLGTITPHGADVYSYADDEDDMVEDPLLAQHLRHWGINMMTMQKTEKSMTELQIDLNMSFEYDKITEAGSKLKPLSGAGYVGLVNLGNSCYMNSVLQVLWTLPGMQERYVWAADDIFRTAPRDCQNDFLTQMAKVGVALSQGRTGQPPLPVSDTEDENNKQGMSVRPQFFKSLVGRGHSEFSTAHQQDAVEYIQYLFDVMSRAEHAASAANRPAGGTPNSAHAFRFEIEDRIQCQTSSAVSYKRTATNVLGLLIPVEAASNTEELSAYNDRQQKRARLHESNAEAYIGVAPNATASNGVVDPVVVSKEKEPPVIPRVPFSACLAQWAAEDVMADYYSAAIQSKTTASKRQRFATFPPYLLVQMRRYYVASDWTAKKLEVLVDVPEQLDLESLRGHGLQDDETPQPADPTGDTGTMPNAAPPAPIESDVSIVTALTAMGFSENASKRAALAVNNAGVEAASEWVFAHLEDADFNDPPVTAANTSGVENAVDAEALSMLTAMGFSERAATAALKSCGGNAERAADWLISRVDDLDSAVEQVLSGTAIANDATGDANGTAAVQDSKGLYQLVGFISHMGSNTACGHYVAHIKKEGRWVIYNDDKVAESTNPPKELGYLYLFERVDKFEHPIDDVAMQDA